MKRKSFKKEQRERREKLDTIADQMAGYLNQGQERTGDYHQVFKLVKDPEAIIQQFDEKLRHIAGMLFVCDQVLRFPGYTITYNEYGFSVKVNHFDAPF